jgi:hypothetical protein
MSSVPTFYKRSNQQTINQVQFTPRKRPTPKSAEPTQNDENNRNTSNALTNNISNEQTEQVAEGSRAEKAGLKLGDSIVSVNGQDTSKMTLLQANAVLEQVSNKEEIKLGITKFDEVDEENPNQTPQVHEVVIEGNKKSPKLPFEEELQPPREAYIAQPTRKAWHPVMWEQQEFKLSENYQPEQPHKRVVRNIRKLLSSVADNPSERAKYIEDLLLALPRGSRQRRDDDDE